ncbi:hypothetical protein ACLBPU_09805, partial [Klebsiella pneumoniae]
LDALLAGQDDLNIRPLAIYRKFFNARHQLVVTQLKKRP